MNQSIVSPKWWQYLARFLLGLTIFDLFIYIYLDGLREGFFGAVTFGGTLGSAILSYFPYVILLGLVLLAGIGLVVGFVLKYSLKLYVFMLAISLLPILYLEYF